MYYKTNTLQSYDNFFIPQNFFAFFYMTRTVPVCDSDEKKSSGNRRLFRILFRQDEISCGEELVVEILTETADERGT